MQIIMSIFLDLWLVNMQNTRSVASMQGQITFEFYLQENDFFKTSFKSIIRQNEFFDKKFKFDFLK